jgi:succinoglycan biosynthesis transport protein ExoP
LIEDFVGVIRRRREIFVGFLFVGILGASAYVLTAQPLFTSTAKLIMDTSKIQAFQQQGMSLLGDPQVDAPTVDSQVEIIKSDNVAQMVVKDLRLTDDPEFVADDTRVTAKILSILKAFFVAPAKPDALRRAIGRFSERLVARRIGTTYVIAVSFSSWDGVKSARIANAIIEAYIREQLETKAHTTRRTGMWLESRLDELRAQARLADHTVQDFKAKNKIIDTPQGLINENQLSEISTQLVTARAQTGEARARFDRITELLKKDTPDTATNDVLRSDVIIRLRQQYLDISLQEADLSKRVQPDHPALIYLHNEKQEMQHAIRQELQRIADTYKSELEIARQREAELQRSVDELVSQSAHTNQLRVALRELESRAQTYRTLADAFLQRFMVAAQQESFPVTGAYAISEASPGGKSHPKTILTFAAALAGSTLIGYCICLIRDQLDRVFRTASQVDELLGVPCLAAVPKVEDVAGTPDFDKKLYHAQSVSRCMNLSQPNLLHYVVAAPLSAFADAINMLKVGLDLGDHSSDKEIIGITSIYPSEGKSVTASNLAYLLARSDRRVLLVDCDLRRSSLSNALAPGAKAGLLEVLTEVASLENVLCCDPETGLWFLPVVTSDGRGLQENLLISSARMQTLLERVRKEYDLVVLDLQPLVPLADVQALSKVIDRFVVVVEWGKTRTDAVSNALARTDVLRGKIGGIVINKVNMRKAQRFEGPNGVDFSTSAHTRDQRVRIWFTSFDQALGPLRSWLRYR